jgi:hypothetical protein
VPDEGRLEKAWGQAYAPPSYGVGGGHAGVKGTYSLAVIRHVVGRGGGQIPHDLDVKTKDKIATCPRSATNNAP